MCYTDNMKTKHATSLICNTCGSEEPVSEYRFRSKLNDRGYFTEYYEKKCRECGQVMVTVVGGAACRACRTGEEQLIDYTQVAIMYPVGKN